MGKNNVSSHLRLFRIELEEVHGVYDGFEPFSDDTKMLSRWELLPAEKQGDELHVKVKYSISFEPNALFSIQTQFKIIYRILEEINMKEVNKNLVELAQPCASRNSMMVGQISQYITGGEPLVVVPSVSVKD
jgi:hypothetical protein